MIKKLLLSLLIIFSVSPASARGLLLQSGAVLELASGDVFELVLSDPTAYTVGIGGDYETWPSIAIISGDSFTWLNSATDTIDTNGYSGTASDPVYIYGAGFTITGTHVFDGNWWVIYNLNIDGNYEVSGNNVSFQRGSDIP